MPTSAPLPELSVAICLAIVGGLLAVRGALPAACVMLLVVSASFGGHFLSVKIAGLTVTLDRVLFVWLLGVCLWRRRSGRAEPVAITPGDVALAMLLAILTVSTFTANWRETGVGVATPIGRLVAGYLLPAALYWMARQSHPTEASVGATFALLMGFGIYLAGTGVLEVMRQWWLLFPRHIADATRGLAFGCARGPMLQPVSLGLYVAVGMLITWVCPSRFGRAGRWIAVAILPLSAVALFFTYTRSVWLGAALGMFAVLALTLRRRWRTLILGSMVAASLVMVTMKWDTLLSFQRGTESAAATRQSAVLRLSFAYVSWNMFLDRPWWGVHFGQFPEAKLPYLDDRSTSLDLENLRPLAHHNHFLSLLTETGVLGLSAFVALLVCWITSAWHAWRDPRAPEWQRTSAVVFLCAVAVYLGLWSFHELSFAPYDHGLLFLLAGIACGRSQPSAAAL